MGAEDDVGPRPALRGPQGRPVLRALRHRALLARGRAGLPGRRGPLGVRPLPGHAARRRPARGRRAARVDHDAVDAGLERRGRRRPGADLRAHDLRRGARRGARRAGARRRGGDRGPVQRRGHARRRLRAAVPVHPGGGVRREGPHRPPRRLRQRRRRHRHRPHGDRVRRGRLPARGRAGPQRHQPRRARRHLRRADRPVRGALGQGRRRRPDRGPARARPAAAGGDDPARLPALLALRDAAPLLRQALLVHPHVGDARPPPRRQRDGSTWHPPHIKHGRFGKWLENNVDWAISRERYWGTPLPVWRCENGHVEAVGSFAEVEERSGRPLPDPHRPYVDEHTGQCADAAARCAACRR